MSDLLEEDEPSQNPRSRGLGKGLSALLGDDEEHVQAGPSAAPRQIPIERLRPNRYQPRSHFDEEAIEDLVNSVRENGILQPILVRPLDGSPDHFEIVAGERRWRAAQKAQLYEVPIVVRGLSDREALEIALVENIQREDLSPIEEAKGYQRLIDDFEHTQAVIASTVGKSRSHVANMLRLLGLPDAVQRMLAEGALSMGHARALITADDPEALAKRIVADGMSVRQAEALVRGGGAPQGAREKDGGKSRRAKDADTLALEEALCGRLGLRASIDHDGDKGAGRLTLRYQTLEQLDDLIARLSR